MLLLYFNATLLNQYTSSTDNMPLTCLILLLQTSPAVKQLHEYLNKYRENRYISFPQEIFKDDKNQMGLMEQCGSGLPCIRIMRLRLEIFEARFVSNSPNGKDIRMFGHSDIPTT
ncbi:MAG: hypothetical protein RLO17_13365 [Cyclobacteriaceae bacterium]